MNNTVVIVAGGSGSRLNAGKNKLLVEVFGKTILEHTIDKFVANKNITEIIVVCSKLDFDFIRDLLPQNIRLCVGGDTRSESVMNGLIFADENCDNVLIHDGARPFVSQEIINDCIKTCSRHGSAIASINAIDTIAQYEGSKIEIFFNRDKLLYIQTPQAFKYKDIMKAYNKLPELNYTDDSSVYAEFINKPHYIIGSVNNKKITFAEDLKLFNQFTAPCVGLGEDLHTLSSESTKKLILGGVEVGGSKGVIAHSDGDVLVHAIIDSILACYNMRDIGYHFPDTDDEYKNISSLNLLEKVVNMTKSKGFIKNLSAVISCDKPKLSPFIDTMSQKIASVIGVESNCVSISATTTEKTMPNMIHVTCVCSANIYKEGI